VLIAIEFSRQNAFATKDIDLLETDAKLSRHLAGGEEAASA
jgi:hypothetical protein